MPVTINSATYPSARRDESIVETLHGVKVVDPYRWMEDPDSDETQEWVRQLNAISEPFINAAKSRDVIYRRLIDLWNHEKFTCTTKRGAFYYYSHNTGLQNQYVIYQQKSLEYKGTVFLDTNTLSEDGTTAIIVSSWSHDGSIFAYGLSEKGSDWVVVKFRRCDGTDLPDEINGVKYSSLTWMADGSGIFYSGYPDFKGSTKGTSTEKHKNHTLMFHRIGTDCKDDVVVYNDKQNPEYMMSGSVSLDGRFLFIEISRGCDPYNLLYYVDLHKNGPVTGKLNAKPLYSKLDAKYHYVDHTGDKVLIQTNKNAPMYKLVRIDINDSSEEEIVIEENPTTKMDWLVPIAGDKLLVGYLEDVKTALYVHDLESGKRLYQIPLKIGTVGGLWGRKDDMEMFFSFESHLTPTVVYRTSFHGLAKETPPDIKELRRVQIKGFDASKYETKQVFITSKDGTKIPMFIVGKKGIELNGENPTLLSGYGGFCVSDTPYFSITRLMFVKYFGGVIATANLRGGGEYGEKWHEAGMLHNKQNVFDDMIGAAQWLIDNKYTTPKK